jgi:hypothetical protein
MSLGRAVGLIDKDGVTEGIPDGFMLVEGRSLGDTDGLTDNVGTKDGNPEGTSDGDDDVDGT